MPSLKEVKTRIGSVVSTQQITKAMKMVAAAKLRKSQDRIMQMRPFAKKMTGIMQNLSGSQEGDAWYAKVRPENRILLVCVTSDRGLCGSFNSSIVKHVVRLINEDYAGKQVTVLTIGRKGFDFFSKRKQSINGDFTSLLQTLSFDHVTEVADFLMKAYQTNQYDKIQLVYNQFKNVATQILITESYLPVLPVKQEKKKQPTDYIYQPNQQEILSGLIPKSLRVQLFKALLDSMASENGARMTAMDKANENAGELLKSLRLMYNRTRQAAITKEILEIVAGAEALKGT